MMRRIRTPVLSCVVCLLWASLVSAFICEKADLLFRDLADPFSWLEYHTGIYYHYVGGDPEKYENHLVIESIDGPGVRIVTLELFVADEQFHGARKLKGSTLTLKQRNDILALAEDLEGSPYPPYAILGAVCKGPYFRCDGLAEFCYESVGIDIVTETPTLVCLPANLTPKKQFDAMEPAVAGFPEIELFDCDNQHVYVGYPTYHEDIKVRVTDGANGSGLGHFKIEELGPAFPMELLKYTNPQDLNMKAADYILSDLPVGEFRISASDQAGNTKTQVFQRLLPAFEVEVGSVEVIVPSTESCPVGNDGIDVAIRINGSVEEAGLTMQAKIGEHVGDLMLDISDPQGNRYTAIVPVDACCNDDEQVYPLEIVAEDACGTQLPEAGTSIQVELPQSPDEPGQPTATIGNPLGNNQYVFTLDFPADVRDVVASGVVLGSPAGPASTFTGKISLQNECMDDQPMVVAGSAASAQCAEVTKGFSISVAKPQAEAQPASFTGASPSSISPGTIEVVTLGFSGVVSGVELSPSGDIPIVEGGDIVTSASIVPTGSPFPVNPAANGGSSTWGVGVQVIVEDCDKITEQHSISGDLEIHWSDVCTGSSGSGGNQAVTIAGAIDPTACGATEYDSGDCKVPSWINPGSAPQIDFNCDAGKASSLFLELFGDAGIDNIDKTGEVLDIDEDYPIGVFAGTKYPGWALKAQGRDLTYNGPSANPESLVGVEFTMELDPGDPTKHRLNTELAVQCNAKGRAYLQFIDMPPENEGGETRLHVIPVGVIPPCTRPMEILDVAGKPLDQMDWVPKESQVTIKGEALVSGEARFKVINVKRNEEGKEITKEELVFPSGVVPYTDAPCFGKFEMKYTVKAGVNYIFGQTYGYKSKPCGPKWIINADPSFVFPDIQRMEPVQGAARVYLSPVSSPGEQDVGIFMSPYETAAQMTVRVHDGNGQVIRILLDDAELAPDGYIPWDGKDDGGQSVKDGEYRLLGQGRLLNSATPVEFSGIYVVDNTLPRCELDRIEGFPEVGGTIRVIGTARDENFKEYVVQVTGSDGVVREAARGNWERFGGVLGVLPPDLPAGETLIVSRVTDLAGNSSRFQTKVNLRGPPPQLRIVVEDISSSIVSSSGSFVQDNTDIYVDDQSNMPKGVTLLGTDGEGSQGFKFVTEQVYSGLQSHTSGAGNGHRVHYFIHADEPLLTDSVNRDLVVQYVYLTPGVQQIMLQFYTDNGDGEHRAYWGPQNSLIQTGGVPGTDSLRYMGAFPQGIHGRWVRLKVPADAVGIAGKPVKGIAFHVHGSSEGAQVFWDKTTTAGSNKDLLANLHFVEPGQFDDYTEATMRFSTSRDDYASLCVMDDQNQPVKTLIDGNSMLSGGLHHVTWDGRNDADVQVADGTYHFQFGTPDTDAIDCDRLEPVLAGGVTVDLQTTPINQVSSLTDPEGNNWEIDTSNPANHRIVKRDSGGGLLGAFDGDNLPFSYLPFAPAGLALDGNGNVYVVDKETARLVKISPELTYLGEVLVPLQDPVAAMLDSAYGNEGHVFVRNENDDVVQVNVGRIAIEQKNTVADIVLPTRDSLVRGHVPIVGTASARNFKEYALTLSRTVNGELVGDIARSTSERVMTLADLIPPGNVTLSGNLGTLDVGRDEYAYIPLYVGPTAPPAEHPGLNGVYTVGLQVDTLDGRTAKDSVVIIVGRLLAQAYSGKSFSDDERIELRVPSMSLENSFEIVALFPTQDVGRNTWYFAHPGLTRVSEMYEARPAGLKFNNPATITMKYGDLDLDDDGVEDVTPEQLGIYAWDMVNRRWVRLESSVDTTSMQATAEIDQIGSFVALYALFADGGAPEVPVIVEPVSPTVLPSIAVRVKTEPGITVEVYARPEGDEFTLAGKAASDSSGFAVVGGVPLALNGNEIRARAVDAVGNVSQFSDPVTVIRDPPTLSPTLVTLHTADYSEELGSCCVDVGDRVGIEAQAAGDTGLVETVVVRAYSSESDPDGIEIALHETAADSGEFRGVLNLRSVSNPGNQSLAAGKNLELVSVAALQDDTKSDFVQVLDASVPLGPVISSETHPSHMQLTFEDGRGNVRGTAPGVTVFLESGTAASGQYSVKVQNGSEWGSFTALLVDEPYSLGDYPILAFDYMIPAPAAEETRPQLGLWVEAGGRWYHYNFTENRQIATVSWTTLYAKTMGTIPNVVADGTWRHVEIPLRDSIGDATVTRIMLGNYTMIGYLQLVPAQENPPGSFYYLDNILITQAGTSSLVPQFTWEEPEDASGVAGYSVTLDADPATEPDVDIDQVSQDISFSGDEVLALESGKLYLHVRAIDQAGNAGLTNHFRIGVDIIGPEAQLNSGLPGSGSLAPPGEISLIVRDNEGGSGLDLDGVGLSVNGHLFTPADGGFSYDSYYGKLTFRLGQVEGQPLIIQNGEIVSVELVEAPDKAGNPLQAPLQWSFIASFEQFGSGEAVLVTIGGGRQPSWSPDSSRIVFSRPIEDEGWKLFTIAPDDLQEQGGTLEQLTPVPLDGEADDRHPAWCPEPDSTLIAFEREVGGQTDIYLADASAPEAPPVQLTDTFESEHHPTWSSDVDGQWIVFELANEIWRIPAAGGLAERIYSDPQRMVREPYCQLGDRIVYRNALYVDNIHYFDLVTKAEGALTDQNTESQPSGSPDAQQVVFVSQRENAGAQLWVMDRDGSEARKLLDNPGGFADTNPEFAPDGSAIAFESTRNGVSNIWLLNTLKLSPLLVKPKAFSPGNADGQYDDVVLSYTVTAQALVTIKVNGPGVTGHVLVQDKSVSKGVDTLGWDGEVEEVLSQSGEYTFEVTAQSPYGGDPLVEKVQVRLDDLAPATTLPSAGSFVKKEGGSVAVGSIDKPDYQGSGVKQLLVREGSNAFVTRNYAPVDGIYPILVNETVPLSSLSASANSEGPHSIQARGIDGVGNSESVKATNIIVDAKAPRIAVTPDTSIYEPSPGVRYARSAVKYTVEAVDDQATVAGADSGMSLMQVNGADQAGHMATHQFAGEGPQDLLVRAWDNVGWFVELKYPVIVDDTPPSCGAATDPPAVGNGVQLFTSVNAVLQVAAVDGVSGVAELHTKLYKGIERMDGGTGDEEFIVTADTTYDATLDAVGKWRVEFEAADNAGNVSDLQVFEVVVTDQPLPGVLLSVVGPRHEDAQGRIYMAARESENTSSVYMEAVDLEVDEIHHGVDGAGPSVFSVNLAADPPETATFYMLSAGKRVIEYYGVRDGVSEVKGAVVLLADGAAPTLAAFTLSGAAYLADGQDYITSYRTTGQVSFSDPEIEAGVPGSGVAAMRYGFNSGALGLTDGEVSFSGLPSGQVEVKLESEDFVGNSGVTSRIYTIDDLAPETDYSFTGLTHVRPADGRIFVTDEGGAPEVRLEATDNDGGSGVNDLGYKLNGSASGDDLDSGSSPVTVTVTQEGPNVLRYRAADNLDNTEALQSLPFYYDKEDPETVARGKEPAFLADTGDLYVGQPTLGSAGFYLDAEDGEGAGVEVTRYDLDSAGEQDYTTGSLIALDTEKQYPLVFFSQDHLGNAESPNSRSVYLDLTPPGLSLTPQAGAKTHVEGAVTYAAPGAVLEAQASDAVSGAGWVSVRVDARSPERSDVAGDTVVQDHVLAVALPDAEGVHPVTANGADRVGNVADAVEESFTVDATAPVTPVTPVGEFLDQGVVKYVDPQTTFLLEPDDLLASGEAGSGVASIFYRIDGGTYVEVQGLTTTVGPLPTLGDHVIDYYTVDNVGNAEEAKSLALTVVDEVPSVALVVVGASAYVDNKLYVRADTATDPSTIELSVREGGALYVWYRIDDNPHQIVAGPAVPLGEWPSGPRTLRFKGVDDMAGSSPEAETTVSIVGDASAPDITLTALDDVPASVADGGRLFVRPTAQLELSAGDPDEGAESGSGVESLAASLDGGPQTTVGDPITIQAQGEHVLDAEAVDRVGLIGTEQYVIAVDGTSPSSWILPSGALVQIGGLTYGPGSLTYTVLAQDGPAGAASGIGETLYGLEGAPPTIQFDPENPIQFTTDGLHTIKHQAKDKLGNPGTVGTFEIRVDISPPGNISLVAFGATHEEGELQYGAPSASYGVNATDAGVGLSHLEIRRDEGVFEPYAVPVSFAVEGEHLLGVKAYDRVGNVSPVEKFPILTDATPPETEVEVESGPNKKQDQALRISFLTQLRLVAEDPDLGKDLAGSGVNEIRYQLPSGEEQAYLVPFSIVDLEDGPYQIEFFSRDNVLNEEARKTFGIYLDNTAPDVPAVVFSASTGSVVLSWQASDAEDLAGYRVYRLIDGTGRVLISGPGLLDESVLTFTDEETPDLEFDDALTYEVTAVDVVENESDPGTVVVEPHDLAPRVDILLAGQPVEDGAFLNTLPIQLDVEVRGAVSATIKIKLGDVFIHNIDATEFTVDLDQEGAYLVSVVARRNGDSFTEERAFTLDVTPPEIAVLVNGLELASGARLEPPVLLEFDATDANLEEVSGTLNGVAIVSGLTLTLEGDYTLVAVARDKAGNETSLTLPFTIEERPPSVVTFATEAGDGIVRAGWQMVTGTNAIDEIEVFRSAAGNPQALRTTLEPGVTGFDDVRVENRVEYTYFVRARDAKGMESELVVATPVTPQTVDWPAFQRDVLHEGNDPGQSIPPPLGERWRVSYPPRPPDNAYFRFTQGPVVVGERLYATCLAGKVRAYRSDDGTLLWESPTEAYGAVSTPVLHNGRLYVTHQGPVDGLTVFNAENGEVEWSLPISYVGRGQESSPVIYRGVLYAGMIHTGQFRLVAVDVDPASETFQEVLWVSAGMPTFIKSSPAAALGKVYVVDGQGNVRAFDAETGTPLWTRSLGLYVTTTQAISLTVSPPVVLIAHENGHLYAFNATTGTPMWSKYVAGKYTSPALSDGKAYIASQAANTVYARDVLTGALDWMTFTYSVSGTFSHGTPVIADGRLHVYATNGQLFTIDLAGGTVLDTLTLGVNVEQGAFAAGSGQLYLPTLDGEIVAVTPVNPAPLELAATDAGTAIDLNWIPPEENVHGIAGYRIYRSDAQGTAGAAIADVSGATSATFTDGTVVLGVRYYYVVRAFDSRGVIGRASNEATAATYLPVSLVATGSQGKDGYVTLSWQLPASSYNIVEVEVRRREAAGESEVLRRVPAGPGTFDDLRVENRLEYGYVLHAVDDQGRLGYPSVEVTATPLTKDWPAFQRDVLHEGNDPAQNIPPPLGERWRVTLPAWADGRAFTYVQGPIVVDDRLYVTSRGGDVRAYDALTGAQLWSKSGFTLANTTPVYHHGRLYAPFYGPPGGLAVLDAQTGKAEWDLHESVFGRGQQSSPVVYRGVLYAGVVLGGAFKLVAVDVDPSSAGYKGVLWSSAGLTTFIKCSPAAALGKVYVVDGSGRLRAYDAETGAPLWVRFLAPFVTSTQAVNLTVEPPVVLVAHENGQLYAFDAESGNPMWNKFVAGRHTSPALDDGKVYVASQSANTVYARDALTGDLEWIAYTYTVTGDHSHGTPVIANGRLHVYATNGQLFSIDLATEVVVDTLNLDMEVEQGAFVTGSGQLYVPTLGNEIVAVTPVTRAPENLATSRQIQAIALGWTPPAVNVFPVEGYRIYRSVSASDLGAEVGYVTGAESSTYEDPVPGGQTFYYRIAAVDERGVQGRISTQASGVAFYEPNIVAAITSPVSGQLSCPSQEVFVIGSADSGNFAGYTLEVDEGNGFEQIAEGSGPVTNGVLGIFTPSQAGYPILRLTVYDATGQTGMSEVYMDVPAEALISTVVWPKKGQTIYGSRCGAEYPMPIELRGAAEGDYFKSYQLQLFQLEGPGPGIPIPPVQEFDMPMPGPDDILGIVTLPDCGWFMIRMVVEDVCGRTVTTEVRLYRYDTEVLIASIITFSEKGRDPGEHRRPMDVAVDREDYVWVADTGNARLQKYTADGRLLMEFGAHRTGNAEGVSLMAPVSVAVDAENALLVLDRLEGKVYRFDENGVPLGEFGGQGKDAGQFLKPQGLALDEQGQVYVADTLNHRVQVLTPEGAPHLSFGSQGLDEGQFDHPTGVWVDPNTDNILVADSHNHRVQVFDSEGEYLSSIGGYGLSASLFDAPYEAIVGQDHNLFTSEVGNNRFSWRTLFGTEERLIAAIPPVDYPDRLLKQPHGLAFDGQETMLYIADTGNNRVVGVRIKEGHVDEIAPRAVLVVPAAGATVMDVVRITGIAADAYFDEYRVEYGVGTEPEIFAPIQISESPVWGGELALWDTQGLDPGTYTLRLTVLDRSGNQATDEVTIQLAGAAPLLIVDVSTNPGVFLPGWNDLTVTYRLGRPADVSAVIVAWGSNRPVREFEMEVGALGENTLVWDGRDEGGVEVKPGRYFLLLFASDGDLAEKKAVRLLAVSSPEALAGALGGPGSYGGLPGSVAGVPSGGAGSVPGVPTGGGTGSPGATPDPHDRGVDNGRNPQDHERGTNPGKHSGN